MACAATCRDAPRLFCYQPMRRRTLRLETCGRSQKQESWPEDTCRFRRGEGGKQNQLLRRKKQADYAKASCRETHEAAAWAHGISRGEPRVSLSMLQICLRMKRGLPWKILMLTRSPRKPACLISHVKRKLPRKHPASEMLAVETRAFHFKILAVKRRLL